MKLADRGTSQKQMGLGRKKSINGCLQCSFLDALFLSFKNFQILNQPGFFCLIFQFHYTSTVSNLSLILLQRCFPHFLRCKATQKNVKTLFLVLLFVPKAEWILLKGKHWAIDVSFLLGFDICTVLNVYMTDLFNIALEETCSNYCHNC